ncbi:DUF1002 domain-containing protein [uncultured Clostridium sp.]|uniref:DUF1002 domain-containing protein n=1 Tax=uncultured Clostridium sp. TaxID=59620 RepID=UPI0025DA5973|nr:DUF1002 domain-containing protein [uncultured Clostridium sp.]
MKLKKRLISLGLCVALVFGSSTFAFADGSRVVTLGANLNEEQKDKMLKYFGVDKNEVVVLEVNNDEERQYLEGVASEAQIGTKTFSCSYVEPKESGNGINVKTANVTWVTSSMVATTLSTAGLTDADCVIASPFPVSGTGALTGIMKAFEDATGKKLDEDKKELACEELITTGDLGDDIGQEKATGVVNDIKKDIIKNGTSDAKQIADTINNVTNNYNVTLTDEQKEQIQSLMEKISAQDYNYKEMKDTLNGIGKTISDKLDAMGEKVDKGFFDGMKDWFSGVGDWFSGIFSSKDKDKDSGILGETNDSVLGDNVKIDSTDDTVVNNTSDTNNSSEEGFFKKVWHWFTGLFSSDDSDNAQNSNETEDNSTNENVDNSESNADNSNVEGEESSN